MTLTQFINKYLGQKVDFDGQHGYQCFTKDHCVLMADWTYKPIQDVKIGDKVIGYDNKINTVTELFNQKKEVIHIRTELNDFYVTPEHPFYCTNGKFEKAEDLNNFIPALYDNEVYKESGLTDKELLFLGFWLGDGNIALHNDNRTDEIRVTYGKKKREFVLSLGILGSERIHQNTENAYVSGLLKNKHPLLTQIILEKCAGKTKQLPLIFSNRELNLIIEGLIKADGCLKNNSYVILNTSLPLLLSIQSACIKLGYSTKSIRFHKRSTDKIKINGKLVKSIKPLYRLTISKHSKSQDKRYIRILERKIETVYNIETDGTHTYICNNYKVHNCVDLYRQYVKDVLQMEQTPPVEGAKDIFEKSGNLSVTVDSVLADYSKGDILIWNSSKTNKYGHVAILVDIYNTKYFIVLEQDGFKQDGVKLAFRSRENLRGCLWKKS